MAAGTGRARPRDGAISGIVIQAAGTLAAFVSAGAVSLAAALFGASRVM